MFLDSFNYLLNLTNWNQMLFRNRFSSWWFNNCLRSVKQRFNNFCILPFLLLQVAVKNAASFFSICRCRWPRLWQKSSEKGLAFRGEEGRAVTDLFSSQNIQSISLTLGKITMNCFFKLGAILLKLRRIWRSGTQSSFTLSHKEAEHLIGLERISLMFTIFFSGSSDQLF